MENKITEQAIEKIQKQIEAEKYKKFGNEWNVANQLIDVVAYDPTAAEIVYQDIENKDLSVKSVVKKIVKERLTDPYKVMEKLCQFYSIPVPKDLPLEYWRSETLTITVPKKESANSGRRFNIDPLNLFD